jgi:hypothetical protein
MPSIVQSGIAISAAAPTLNFTFPLNVTAGNTIMVIATAPFTGFGIDVTDSLGNGYGDAGDRDSGTGSPTLTTIAQKKAVTAVSGPCTVTVAPLSANFPINAYFVEFSPDIQITYPGIGNGNRSVNNNNPTPGSATVNVSTGGIPNTGVTVLNIFVGLGFASALTWTANAGFTIDKQISNPAGQSFCGGCRFDPDASAEPWNLILTTTPGHFLAAYMQAWNTTGSGPPPTPGGTGFVMGTFTSMVTAGQFSGGTK